MKTLFLAAVLSIPGFAQVVATFPNANIFLSPGTWRTFSGSIDAPTGGAYLIGSETGASTIVANVDTSGNSAQTANGMPSFKVTIDSGVPVIVQEGLAATTITLASGLAGGTHTYLVQVIGGSTGVGNSWTGTASHTIINSLQFENGTTLIPPTTRPKTVWAFGDSYLMSVVAASFTTQWYNFVNFTQSWPQWIGAGLNAEIMQEGIGSCGWVHAGDGGFPAFTGWWDHYDSTHARDLSVPPDFLFIAIGVNDHVGTVSAAQINTAMNSWHTAMRATSGWANVPTYIIIPFADVTADAVNHAQIVTTANAWGDNNAHVINIGTSTAGAQLSACLPFSGPATFCSFDALHPDIPHHGQIAAMISAQMVLGTPSTVVTGNAILH